MNRVYMKVEKGVFKAEFHAGGAYVVGVWRPASKAEKGMLEGHGIEVIR